VKVDRRQLNRMVENIFAESSFLPHAQFPEEEDPRSTMNIPIPGAAGLAKIKIAGTIPEAVKAIKKGELFSISVSLEISEQLKRLANSAGFLNDPESGYTADLGELVAQGAEQGVVGEAILKETNPYLIAAGLVALTGLIIYEINNGYGVKVEVDPGDILPGSGGSLVFKPPAESWPEGGGDANQVQDSPPEEIEDVSVTDVEERLVAEVIRRLTRK